MPPRAACTASASASSMRCRPRPSSRSRATRSSTARAFRAGSPTAKLDEVGAAPNRRGTTVAFVPDPEIFGADAKFSPERLYKLARSKAYLFAGVEIRWHCDPALADATPCPRARCSSSPAGSPTISPSSSASARARHQPALRRPPGLSRRRRAASNGRSPGRCGPTAATAIIATPSPPPTAAPTRPGLRAALTKGIRAFGELVGQKKGEGHHRRRRHERRRADALASSSATRISRARPRTA